VFADGKSLVEGYKAANGAGVKFILMDINMPGMDGYTVIFICDKIRQHPKSEHSRKVRAYQQLKYTGYLEVIKNI